MTYGQREYERERAICDKANSYAAQFRQANGWTVIPAEAASHPDYAACDNDMRSRVERYEFLRDTPARYSAYLDVKHGEKVTVTTWTGDALGTGWGDRFWRDRWGNRMMAGTVTIEALDGRRLDYRFRGQGDGMICSLRRTKA